MLHLHPGKVMRMILITALGCLILVLTSCSIFANPTPTSTVTANVPTTVATITPIPTPTRTPRPTPTPIRTADEDHSQHYMIDNFEMEALFVGEDADGIGLGFVTWGDSDAVMLVAGIRQISADDELAMPLQSGHNRVLAFSGSIPEWGGVTHNFEGASGDVWASMDWSTWLGVTFWVYGSDTDSQLLFEIQENRNPGSTVNDVEVWSYTFRDNFSGWKQFFVPWNKFHRKEIGNGAPQDGRTLTEVHGWAFGVVDPTRGVTYYLDDIALYGEVAGLDRVDVTFETHVLNVTEGGWTIAALKLTNACSESVTVNYAVQSIGAVEGKDFEPLTGTVTFEPNQTYQGIEVALVDDGKPEDTESLVLVMTGAENATLGELTSVLIMIEDDDPADPNLLMDIEDEVTFDVQGEDRAEIVDISPDSELALPEQTGIEGVLAVSVESGEVVLTQRYAEPQDWSGAEEFSFWYYGAGNGETVTVELWNNPAFKTQDLASSSWVLSWADEFEGEAGSAPDAGHWVTQIGNGLTQGNLGWGNNELEYYTAETENLSLDGEGHLVITAQALGEDADLACWYGPCEFTSAKLTTQDRLELTYGRVEASMQLPEGVGLWPAFWMMGADSDTVDWPNSGEIDVMEFIGSEPGVIYGTAHGPGYEGAEGLGGSVDLGLDLSAGFHEYAVEWEPDEIRWYVDDRLYATVNREDTPGEWVFDHPFYLLLNLAVGGNWPGSPTEETVFPQSLVVDYVRVYGAADSFERFEASFVDDFTGWRQVALLFSDFIRSVKQPWRAPADGLDLSQIYAFSLSLANRSNPYYLDQFMLRD